MTPKCFFYDTNNNFCYANSALGMTLRVIDLIGGIDVLGLRACSGEKISAEDLHLWREVTTRSHLNQLRRFSISDQSHRVSGHAQAHVRLRADLDVSDPCNIF